MQAFLITAYKNQEQLVKLIQSLNEHALVFVHLDKKSTELSLEELTSYHLKNTQFISKYNIPWGGYTHLLAILTLFKMALADERVHYIHTISAQDIRICSMEEMEKRFATTQKIYMTCTDALEIPAKTQRRFRQHIITSRGTGPFAQKLVKKANTTYTRLQKRLHINYTTIKPFKRIYKGMIWCSMPRKAAEYALNECEKTPSFLRHLKHITLPEEFFFQSIFMDSPFRDDVVNENLRYTDWTRRYDSRPAILDATDFDKIIESNCIFARKIDAEISKELIEKMDAYLQ